MQRSSVLKGFQQRRQPTTCLVFFNHGWFTKSFGVEKSWFFNMGFDKKEFFQEYHFPRSLVIFQNVVD